MFYRQEQGQLITHPQSPTIFGAQYGIIPTPEEIELYAGWFWFEHEDEARSVLLNEIST